MNAESEPNSTSMSDTLVGAEETITSSLDAPTFFVEGVHGVMVSDDIVKLAFFENRQDVQLGKVVRYHTVRLNLPRSQFSAVLDHLNSIHKDMEQGGG